MRRIGKDWKDEVVCCLGTAVISACCGRWGFGGGGWEGVDDFGGFDGGVGDDGVCIREP